jgi:hypothetical protein
MDNPSLKIEDATLNASIQFVREYATSVMKDLIDVHFTDHGIGHLDRIAKTIDLLLKQNDKQKMLSELERYILFSSVLLHDIGMQYEVGEPEPQSRRNQHHTYSSEIILSQWKEIGLKADLVNLVALVAEGHRGHIDDRYKPQMIGTGQEVRCDLLAALLYLCDELDITYERTNPKRKALLDYDAEAQLHYYKHYYIQALDIGLDRCLHICFRYPSGRTDQYHPVFSKLVKEKIQKTIRDVTPILLEKYSVFIALRDDDITIQEDRTIDAIEPSVFEEITSIVRGVRSYRFLNSLKFSDMLGDINAELFYKGNVRWADIVNGLDIERDQHNTVSSALSQLYDTTCSKQACSALLICGEGGSGKTTTMMRLAYETKDDAKFSEASFLWLPPDCDFTFDELMLLHGATRKPLIVFIDGLNINVTVDRILDKDSESALASLPCVFVVAARLNEWQNAGGSKITFCDFKKIQLGTLVDLEITKLLEKLAEHNQLYELQKLSPTRRFETLKSKSDGQLLVAMLEATRAKHFFDIIIDEYTNLRRMFPDAAKAYALISLFYVYDVLIPRDLLINLVQCADWSEFEESVLAHTALIIVRDNNAKYGIFYRPRHKEIASVLVDRLPDFETPAKRLRKATLVVRAIRPNEKQQRYTILNFLNNYVTAIKKLRPKAEYQDRMDEARRFIKDNMPTIRFLNECAESQSVLGELFTWGRLYRELRLIFENIELLERILRIEPFEKRANYIMAKLLSHTATARSEPERIAKYYHNSYVGGNRQTKFLYEYLEFCLRQSLFDHLDPIIDSFNDFISFGSEEEDLGERMKALVAGYKLNKDRGQMVKKFNEIASNVGTTKDLNLSDELAYIDLVESGNPKTRLEQYQQHLMTISPNRPRGILVRIAHTATLVRGEEETAMKFFKELVDKFILPNPQAEDFDVVFEYVTFTATNRPLLTALNYSLYKLCKKLKPTDLKVYADYSRYALRNGQQNLAKQLAEEGIEVARRLDKFDTSMARSLRQILASI